MHCIRRQVVVFPELKASIKLLWSFEKKVFAKERSKMKLNIYPSLKVRPPWSQKKRIPQEL